jgi:hypothetical protein
MNVIRKKSQASSITKLIQKSTELIFLLEGQKEDEAISDLQIALDDLKKHTSKSSEYTAAIKLILECFEGEHDLLVYTQTKESQKETWGEAEKLYLASSEVYTLAKRISKSIS